VGSNPILSASSHDQPLRKARNLCLRSGMRYHSGKFSAGTVGPMNLKRVWADASPARRLMTAIIVLLFVSQFLPYHDDTSHSMLLFDSDFNSELTTWFGQAAGTGWQLHPQAYVIIAGLVLVYLNDISETTWWSRWGWWVSVVLIFVAVVPATTRTIGGVVGLGCVMLAIVAAVLNSRERKTRPAR
jgi:hypothetical protein